MLIGRGGTGDGAADARKGSRRGSSGVRGKGNKQVQCDGRGRRRGWSARQVGCATYR